MVGFKGRSKMKQSMPAEHTRNGFKVWMLVDCGTGYVYNFDIYEGKGEQGPETGQSQRVVTTLIKPLEERRWHVIGMDGFFSSVELFEKLHAAGFYAVATTRNWLVGFPKSLLLTNAKLTEGQWIWRRKGAITLVSWYDQKPVNLLSTYCDPTKVSDVQRWRKSSTSGRRDKRRKLQCPEVVVEYHKWMRGVDVFSQKESYSRIGRKSRRWWPRLAWFLIDICVSNAFVLYQQHCVAHAAQTGPAQGSAHLPSDAASQKAFRRSLMHALAEGFTARKKRGRPTSHPRLSVDEPQHIPRSGLPQRSCISCASKHTKSSGVHKPRTTAGCMTCGVAVHIDEQHAECWREHLPRREEEENEE
jgi:hypothetical protein